MKTRCTITLTAAVLLLTACNGMTPYEKQPPLNFNMNCKQITLALEQAKESLERIKKRRDTISDEDVGVFLLTLGTPSYGGQIAEKEAEDRIATLQSAAISRRCTITYTAGL